MRVLFGILLISIGLVFGLFSLALLVVGITDLWSVFIEGSNVTTYNLGETFAHIILLILSALLTKAALASGVRRIMHDKTHFVDALDEDILD